ncbi:MAG TPA: hypothetical protein PK198_25395 [Saprospiraceae bacterium]|nr:hypothetical protein [Saprospiraceae bacterium]HRJ14028.1 hypothetical protein [Saprospiraceae bacterium]HRK82712.1 hypothetical protein [Saprospiraceae bacterium]
MQRVSSNITLVLMVFVPIVWLTFFGALTITLWYYNLDYYGAIPGLALRLGLLLFMAASLLFFYLTCWRLKRVETDEHFIYVTNYIKHVRYPVHQVASVKKRNWGLFHTFTIRLKTPGSFGPKVTFIPSGRFFDEYIARHPEWTE